MLSDEAAVPKPSQKHTRTRTGCLNCRRKKRKCDEGRPICGTCHRRKETCSWGVKLKFLAENAKCLTNNHPSMQMLGDWRGTECEFLDATEDIIRDYDIASSPTIDDSYENEDAAVGLVGVHQANGMTAGALRIQDDGHSVMAADHKSTPSPFAETTHVTPPWVDGPSPSSVKQTESAVANLIYLSRSTIRPSTGNNETISSTTASTGIWAPDIGDYRELQLPDEDGIFLPGTTYHELHSTLRSHLIHEGRSNDISRLSSPVPVPGELSAFYEGGDDCRDDSPPGASLLSKEEEIHLWRNWFEEISPWVDKFDNDQHFKHIIPTMVPSNPYLKYSVLALAARQVELKETLPHDRSLLLYQQAIHLLLPHLSSRSTAVIASCVILCVLEMLSCSPKAWRRHLDGCACLLSAVGINGFSAGIQGALFWCFARMDVCGGLISSVKTLVPVSQWASGLSLDIDVEMFKTRRNDFHSWANFAVYLLAQVLDLLGATTMDGKGRHATWEKLWDYIEEWYELRPAALHSIITLPSNEKSPFPTIIYSNPAAISSNQLYHTASLLMLQNRPQGTRLPYKAVRNSSATVSEPAGLAKSRGILWHARRVCGISISNDHHGAWTNAVQPIWIAGRCMSHPAEHRAIIELLNKMERESGWSTRWRANDLREFWGDL